MSGSDLRSQLAKIADDLPESRGDAVAVIAQQVKRRRRRNRVAWAGAVLVCAAAGSAALLNARPHSAKRVLVGADGAATTTIAPSTTTLPTTSTPSTATAPGSATGHASDRDLTVDVRAVPIPAGVGSPVRFSIQVIGLRVDGPYAVTMQFGDGAGDNVGAAGCGAGAPGTTTSTEPPPPPSTTKTVDRTHVYGAQGKYRATVMVFSGYQCASTTWSRHATASVSVTIQ